MKHDDDALDAYVSEQTLRAAAHVSAASDPEPSREEWALAYAIVACTTRSFGASADVVRRLDGSLRAVRPDPARASNLMGPLVDGGAALACAAVQWAAVAVTDRGDSLALGNARLACGAAIMVSAFATLPESCRDGSAAYEAAGGLADIMARAVVREARRASGPPLPPGPRGR